MTTTTFIHTTTITITPFLWWWNDQTIKTQQDWFTRHTHENDAQNWALANANQKTRKSSKRSVRS